MRKAIIYSFCVISLSFLISMASVTEARAQNALGEIYRRMDLNNRSLQSLQADVTMVKTNVQLNVSDTTYGNTSYLTQTSKRGRYVRIDWTRPVQEQISLIGDDYELYRPKLNQVIIGKVSKAKNSASVGGALSFLSMSKAQLEANYSSAYLAKETIQGGIETAHIQLTPKAAANYKLADLWVDADGMPRQAMITELNNDTTTVLLSNIKKNVTLDGKIFKLTYPGSVKKIKS
jgi:outer membrane lipoprotein-sorting protein